MWITGKPVKAQLILFMLCCIGVISSYSCFVLRVYFYLISLHCACVQVVCIIMIVLHIWCMFVRASLYVRREEDQLDATEWFIVLVICSTCFGHFYAQHRELETILVLLLHMVCNAGGRRLGAGQQAMRPVWRKGAWPAALHLTADHQQPRHYTSYAVITQV